MSKKKFLVTTNFECGGRVLHSFSIMNKKQARKFDKTMVKHFKENDQLVIKVSPTEEVVINSLEEVLDNVSIEDIGVKAATTISDLLGEEYGDCGIDALYTTAKLVKFANSEKPIEVDAE